MSVDLSHKRELATEADEVLKSKAWEAAKANLREFLVNKLATAKSDEERLAIVGELIAIEDIGNELRRLVNDYNAGVRILQRGAARG